MNDIHWFPGHMAKARRLIEEKIKLIDVVIEIIDARIPYSSKNPMMDELVFNKKKIIIMSKIDLADAGKTKQWQKYYEQQGYYVITSNLLDFKELKSIVTQIQIELKEQLLKEQKRGLKPRAIRALVVGIPNVGKSTLINKLAKRSSAKVGNKAGVTKALQWIKVDHNLELLDSPGILWPKLDDKKVALNLALTGAIKDEILPKEYLCFEAMKFMNKNYQEAFYQRYSLVEMDNDSIDSIVAALDIIGQKRGCLSKGNIIDYDKVYDIVLKEVKNATIARMTFDYEITT
ncbi:ribosome biogenesis GTPase YlqF [Erysipelotrichaceae bacterium OttesenSCG-928-M19]|nr:ribosome biogenesis GTPase YlqF [Erysipelotrichaceae bacterium OttesenSCG-928-M19]